MSRDQMNETQECIWKMEVSYTRVLSYPGITDLRAVRINGPRPVNLAKFALHVGEA